jgi:hypothetical protein
MKKVLIAAIGLAALAFASVKALAEPVVDFTVKSATASGSFAYSVAEKFYLDYLLPTMGKMGLILYANAIYQPASNKTPYSGDDGNRGVYADSAVVAANLATTDVINLLKLPAGSLIDRVVIKNPDLDSGANLAVNIGFANCDGTAGESATAVASAATTWQAAATTTYELFPPILLEKDCYLQAVPTVGGVGTGTIYAKAECEILGAS